jgi:hypothetical protein
LVALISVVSSLVMIAGSCAVPIAQGLISSMGVLALIVSKDFSVGARGNASGLVSFQAIFTSLPSI